MPDKIRRGLSYLKGRGPREFALRAMEKTAAAGFDYDRREASGRLNPLEEGYQKHVRLKHMPAVCVMILREGETSYSRELYARTSASIRRQTYRRCHEADVLTSQIGDDDLVVFVKEGDLLEMSAAYELVSSAQEGQLCLYSDEDSYLTVREGGKDRLHYENPLLKPDFDEDYLRSMNYIGHLFAVRARALRQAWGEGQGKEPVSAWSFYDPAAYYRMVLACTRLARSMGNGSPECGPCPVVHISKVLYHALQTGAAGKDPAPGSDPASGRQEDLREVLKEDLRLRGEEGIVEYGPRKDCFHIYYLEEKAPLVSIVIPSKDHIALLKDCLSSVVRTSSWERFEIIVVENNSQDPETFRAYHALERGEVTGQNIPVRVLTYKGQGFNFSKLVNEGVKAAQAAYVVLMNNDVTVRTPDWTERLLSQCRREHTAVAGPKLLYPDGRVQSAGIVAGIMGYAGSMMVGEAGDDPGYMNLASVTHQMSAVTAACMMVKRSEYLKIGGFCPELAVALNDVDFCLRMNEAGQKVIFEPSAVMIHHESLSRGYEISKEQRSRFLAEQRIFKSRHRELLKKGDPHYNPGLSLRKCDYSLSPFPGIL